MKKNIGSTKDSGWQFGIRKTLPSSLENIWNVFFSEYGLTYWAEGVDQDFSTYKEYSHIRTKWKHANFKENVSLQIRFIRSNNNDKTTVSIHIDQLSSERQREETKKYWSDIIGNISRLLEPQIIED